MKRIFQSVIPCAFAGILGLQLLTAMASDGTTDTANHQAEATESNRIADSELHFPVEGHNTDNIISYFGDPRGKSRKHLGVDIKAPRHTAILAVTDGKIEAIRESGNGGRTLYLRSSADGTLYFYAHLQDWEVKENDQVEAGDLIATVGDSGNAKGTTPHLHFEILRGKSREAIDPLPILEGK